MINKLVSKIKKTNAPIVVGLDPMLNYVPDHIKEAAFKEYGETLKGAAEAIWQFNKGIIDNYGNEYTELTSHMKTLNDQKYSLIKFFDAR